MEEQRGERLRPGPTPWLLTETTWEKPQAAATGLEQSRVTYDPPKHKGLETCK